MRFAISMVCFCDLPLSKINNHLKIYGNFGIGLHKLWGIRKGASPVLYVHPNSLSWKSYRNIIIRLTKNAYEGIVRKHRIRDYGDLAYIHSFIKMYEGNFRKKHLIRNYRFYNEREWRYIPSFRGHWPIITEEDYSKLTNKDIFITEDKFKLEFLSKDVKYIVVSKESDVPIIYDKILSICKKNYKKVISKKLLTKIISAEHLKEDF